MAAHLRDIRVPRCARCDMPATKELRDTRNTVIDWYCGKHARVALDRFKRSVGET